MADPSTKTPGRYSAEGCGLWTKEEHARFLSALEIYPNGPWKTVSELVGTRSARQTMTHAQKHRQKIARHERGLRSRKKTGAEVAAATSAVTKRPLPPRRRVTVTTNTTSSSLTAGDSSQQFHSGHDGLPISSATPLHHHHHHQYLWPPTPSPVEVSRGPHAAANKFFSSSSFHMPATHFDFHYRPHPGVMNPGMFHRPHILQQHQHQQHYAEPPFSSSLPPHATSSLPSPMVNPLPFVPHATGDPRWMEDCYDLLSDSIAVHL